MAARMDHAIDGGVERSATLRDRVLGGRLVAGTFSTVTRRRLRILAYHGVDRLDRFAAQVAWLSARWHPVTLEDVAAAITGDNQLPDRAVWVTFDDGHPEIVEAARPVLDRCGIAATIFVCPGLIDTDEPFWWDIVAEASALPADQTLDPSRATIVRTVTELKRLPDDTRREEVEQARARLTAVRGRSPARRQIRRGELEAWVAAGHSVGNHTWDHPCLDMCSAEEQKRQVVQADDWLTRFGIRNPKAFAYPNGNWVGQVEDVLRNLDYHVGVVFDHRLARVDGPSLEMSRLRVSAGAPLTRFRAIVSGSHPAAFSAVHRRR
jgi:peptidoglycan/xylan/chitin deacetylase (PgdA/CDA1 family)